LSELSAAIGIIDRRGERVWWRNISRDTNYATGEPRESYADNQSCIVRIIEDKITTGGLSMFLPAGKAVMYGKPEDFWNNSMKIRINDQIIREPDNYSAGSATIWRVDNFKRMPLINQSQLYLKANLTLTNAKE